VSRGSSSTEDVNVVGARPRSAEELPEASQGASPDPSQGRDRQRWIIQTKFAKFFNRSNADLESDSVCG